MSYVQCTNAKDVQVPNDGFLKKILQKFLANYDKHTDLEPEVWGYML